MSLVEYLARVEAAAEAATEGPWEAVTSGARGGDHWYVCAAGESIALIHANDGSDEDQREPDAAFIALSRDAAPRMAAALRAVLDLHRPVTVYGLADDCECSEGDPDWDDHHFSADVTGDLLCDRSPTGDLWCGECSQDDDGDGTTYPCPTAAAITAALDGAR